MSTRRVVPGFGLSLGYTVMYLSLIVLVPLSAIFFKTATLGWAEFWKIVTARPVMHAYQVSFGTSIMAGVFSVFFGVVVAWTLTRYQFFGRRLIDALIDLPFALPTAVAGIALTTLYNKEGWLGTLFTDGVPYYWYTPTGWQWVRGVKLAFPLLDWQGFAGHYFPFKIFWSHDIAFTPTGITIALIFIGLPFVVRTIQPVLQDMSVELEEAAASLGATRWQTFRRVIFPELWPAILTGFTLSVARALGEYGSVVFISGNLPMKTEIAPQQIITKLEQYNYAGATAIAMVMLIASFVLLMLINLVQKLTVRS